MGDALDDRVEELVEKWRTAITTFEAEVREVLAYTRSLPLTPESTDPFDHWAWWLLPVALVVLCVVLALTA